MTGVPYEEQRDIQNNPKIIEHRNMESLRIVIVIIETTIRLTSMIVFLIVIIDTIIRLTPMIVSLIVIIDTIIKLTSMIVFYV